MKNFLTRRDFVRTAALGGAGLLVLRNSRLANAAEANNTLNVAGIGVGGQGGGDLNAMAGAGANIVALCDVDETRAADTCKKFPQAKRFKDFRRMLDAMDKQIDAVVVATPDHTHA